MKPRIRLTLVLAAAAGMAASLHAQEVMQVGYSWLEVVANTTNAVASPNSVLDAGEGARIRLTATALINGASAVGQTSSYTNPSPGGVGTIRGLGTAYWDLVGDGNNATANGAWVALQGSSSPMNSAVHSGTVQPGGASVHDVGGMQFVLQGQTASGANNVQAFRGVWTPSEYSPRSVNFLARSTVATPPFGVGASVLLCYGFSTALGPEDPYTFDLLVNKPFAVSAGSSITIPIAPTPSTLALLGIAAVAGSRQTSSRRRGPA